MAATAITTPDAATAVVANHTTAAGHIVAVDRIVAAAHTAVAGRIVAAADLTAADRTVAAARVAAVADRAMAVAIDKRC